jgi:hypothetical protein
MKIYLAVLVSLLSFTAKSQINPADSTVQVIAYWSKNETQSYKFDHTKFRIKGNDTTTAGNTSYKVDVTVLDSTASSYTIQWKYRDYTIENKKNDATIAALAKIYDGLTVKFKTDELGTFTELLNWEDIKKHNYKALELFKKELNPTLSQTVTKTLLDKYSTKEAIMAYSLKDISLFHGFFGIAAKQGKLIEEKVQQEQPFGNTPINSLITIAVEDIDFEEGTYIVKYWEDFENEGIKTLLKDLFAEMLADYKNENKEEILKSLEAEDYCGAIMHESGWPIQMHYERVVRVEGFVGMETRTITFE